MPQLARNLDNSQILGCHVHGDSRLDRPDCTGQAHQCCSVNDLPVNRVKSTAPEGKSISRPS